MDVGVRSSGHMRKSSQLQLNDLLALDRDMQPHACGKLLWHYWVQVQGTSNQLFSYDLMEG